MNLPAAVALVLAVSLSVLDTSVLYLALPGIARDLNSTAAGSIWVLNAYQIAVLICLFPFAFLGDRFGYRAVHLWGMGVFTLASLACALSQTLWQLEVARALQGAGAAGTFAVNAALLRTIYPPSLLGRGFAINSGVVAASSVAGPTLAAAVLSVASWHWLFALNIPLGIGVWVAALRHFPHGRGNADIETRPSNTDLLLNTVMLVAVFVGLNQLAPRQVSGGIDWPLTSALLGTGLLVGAWHVRRQWRQTHPLLPVDLLRHRMFALAIVTSVAGFGAYTVGLIALPFLLLQDLALSYRDAGLVMTAWPLATLACAPLTGRLIGRVPTAWLGAFGMSGLAAGLGGLALLPAGTSLTMVAACLVLCGAGFALFHSPNNHSMAASTPAHRMGATGGMMSTARLTGQLLAAVAVATLFGWAPWLALPGTTLSLAAGAACALAGSAICLVRTREL